MSIEYPYEQLPCQTKGGFLQTALSTVTRRSRSCSSPVLLRRVTPDRVLAFMGTDPASFPERGLLARAAVTSPTSAYEHVITEQRGQGNLFFAVALKVVLSPP